MFMSPHDYQAIFEVTLEHSGTDAMAKYLADRKTGNSKMYSFAPAENFVLTDLASPPDHPTLTSFQGTIFRGHFEDGHFEQKGSPILEDIVAHVARVVHFRKFDRHAEPLPQLSYLLWGSSQELLLAHLISRPPDFDQVVGVTVSGTPLSDTTVSSGVAVSVPGRTNVPENKIQEQEKLMVELQPNGAQRTAPTELQLQAGTEFYFETNDLASAM
jgi:hypothetical protein